MVHDSLLKILKVLESVFTVVRRKVKQMTDDEHLSERSKQSDSYLTER